MAVVAQLVERWLVVPDVAGSSPVDRPITVLDNDVVIDVSWVTIVWNDPVNLMSYVARVFRSYFGYPQEEAERLMLLVHTEGKAVVATGPREEMERHTEAMHEYGLWATVQKAEL